MHSAVLAMYRDYKFKPEQTVKLPDGTRTGDRYGVVKSADSRRVEISWTDGETATYRPGQDNQVWEDLRTINSKY